MEQKNSLEKYEATTSYENTDEASFGNGQPPRLPKEITEAVVRYYSPMVYRIALTRTQSKTDTDDIFQEVFPGPSSLNWVLVLCVPRALYL